MRMRSRRIRLHRLGLSELNRCAASTPRRLDIRLGGAATELTGPPPSDQNHANDVEPNVGVPKAEVVCCITYTLERWKRAFSLNYISNDDTKHETKFLNNNTVISRLLYSGPLKRFKLHFWAGSRPCRLTVGSRKYALPYNQVYLADYLVRKTHSLENA